MTPRRGAPLGGRDGVRRVPGDQSSILRRGGEGPPLRIWIERPEGCGPSQPQRSNGSTVRPSGARFRRVSATPQILADPAPAPGELLVVGFDGFEADSTLLDFLVRESIGGVILFRRNVRDAAQVARLTRALREAAPGLLIGIDEEGGRVRRLSSDFTTFPSMDLLGKIGSDDLARELGGAIARELRAAGVNWDFAPVLDVHSNPANPIIGSRAISSDPAVVARLGVAFIDGLQAGGVAGCGKHFPGHGDTSLDSHVALPVVNASRELLEERELVPFRAAARGSLASVMTAHVRYPALDAERTATLSPAILGDLLRRDLGFEGVVVTDDLEMRAVADHASPEELAVASIEAGADVMLACKSRDVQDRVLAGMRSALESGRIAAARLAASVARVRNLRARFPIEAAEIDPDRARTEAGSSRALVARIEQRAQRMLV